MSELNNTGSNSEDIYDKLHKNFSMQKEEKPAYAEESDVKNSGEIYFSANPVSINAARESDYDFDRYLPREEKKSANVKQPSASPYSKTHTANPGVSNKVKSYASASRTVKNSNVSAKRTASGAYANSKNGKLSFGNKKSSGVLLAGIIVAFVLIASMVIRIPIMGCVSDILAIDRDSTEIRVIIDKNSRTKDVINILGKKNLIYSTGFCKAISGFLGYEDEDIFPAGTYYLSADMGLEGMLKEIMSAGQTEATVKVTLPEGFTVDQIIERLSQNGVASENALYGALEDDSLYEDYAFLKEITDKEQRYHALEGYLYPDTYEFYVDENPISVFKRFLDNFNDKWEEKFASSFDGSAHTIDEIITVASILEKEAKDSEQMGVIASILYNRLNSSSFPRINCDSTGEYISAQKEKLEAEGTYVKYLPLYDTYQQTGLPVGPICNPGCDAILAAISPDNTDYYYFLHDKDGKMYTARTESEHIYNQRYLEPAG